MTFFTCPFGCDVQYSRHRDLVRRHLNPVHQGQTTMPEPRQQPRSSDTIVCPPSVENLASPPMSQKRTSLDSSLEGCAPAEFQAPPPHQFNAPRTRPVESGDINLEAKVAHLERELSKINRRLGVTEVELRLLRSLLESEETQRNHLEGQLKYGQANIINLVKQILATNP